MFGGAAWVLFYKDKHAVNEVYNDLNDDLINLFRVAKYHCDELLRELRFVLNSRVLFDNFKIDLHTNIGLTDIQRAARFFIVTKLSFGAKGGTFGNIKKDTMKMLESLKAIEYRLRNVIIEQNDFEFIINNFDKRSSLFYCDPPYYGSENYYTAQFNANDHHRLFECLVKIKHNFILSYNDCAFIRDLYAGFNIHEVERFNNLSTQNKKNSTYKELIITNY